MTKRQVIFVDGTIFSGSTLLQYQIANDPNGFGAGEIAWLLWPTRSGHVNRLRYCSPEAAALWHEVHRRGMQYVYQTIFELRPETRFIVDSSKSPYWTKAQEMNLRATDIAVKRLVVWKTPLELAASMYKRDRLPEWESTWLGYHRLYASLVDDWRAIPYRFLASESTKALQVICDYLEIPYFAGKDEYWDGEHMALGGNMTARFHLETPENAQTMLDVTFDQERMNQYRSTSYSPITDPLLVETVDTARRRQPAFDAIEAMLQMRSLPNGESAALAENLRHHSLAISLRKAKQMVNNQVGRRRYRHQIEQTLRTRKES